MINFKLSNKKIFEIYKLKRKYNTFYYEFKRWLNGGNRIEISYKIFLTEKYNQDFGPKEISIDDIEFYYFEEFMKTNSHKNYQNEAFYLSGYESKKQIKKIKRREEKKKRTEDYNDVGNDFYSTKKWIIMSKRVKNFYGRICMKCGQEKGEMHADHILPRSLYPSFEFDIKNIQVLCKKCNLEKGNKDQVDYRTDEQIKKCNIRFP